MDENGFSWLALAETIVGFCALVCCFGPPVTDFSGYIRGLQILIFLGIRYFQDIWGLVEYRMGRYWDAVVACFEMLGWKNEEVRVREGGFMIVLDDFDWLMLGVDPWICHIDCDHSKFPY